MRGPITALVVLFLVFRFIIAVGEFIVSFTTKVFDALYTPFIMKISGLLGGNGFLHSILIGEISTGIDFEGAMGGIDNRSICHICNCFAMYNSFLYGFWATGRLWIYS